MFSGMPARSLFQGCLTYVKHGEVCRQYGNAVLITNSDDTAYLEEVENLTSWCQTNCLQLNFSKT